MSRVGIGYDSHRLVPGGPLLIGGVEIEFDRGLEGHSDADVLAHAVTDAVLGAAGAGDIGSHFPPVICERPAIGPHRAAIEERLGDALGAPVSVKATTNEGLGAIGREEGIAAIAVASFDPATASPAAGQ